MMDKAASHGKGGTEGSGEQVKLLWSSWICPNVPSSILKISFFNSFFFFCFLGPHPKHMGVHRLGVKSELWLPATATATATATPDPSCSCNIHHSSWQWWIFNPLSTAKDQTCILRDTSRIRFCCATTGTPRSHYFLNNVLIFPYETGCSCGSCCGIFYNLTIKLYDTLSYKAVKKQFI